MTRYDYSIIKLGAFLKNRLMGVLSALSILLLLAGTLAYAEKPWYPIEVDVWQPPFNGTRQRVQKVYVPLVKAQKKWRISAFIPHLKDAYWLGVNYGLIEEARRLGINLSIYAAGGYDQLDIQRRQIEEDLAQKPDGIIIGAISFDDLNDIVKKAHEQGIPVLDLINGISSPLISARAAVSFWDTGYQAGNYLRRIQEKSGNPMQVAWFPGPSGAGWVIDGDAGFQAAIQGSSVHILDTQYGE